MGKLQAELEVLKAQNAELSITIEELSGVRERMKSLEGLRENYEEKMERVKVSTKTVLFHVYMCFATYHCQGCHKFVTQW